MNVAFDITKLNRLPPTIADIPIGTTFIRKDVNTPCALYLKVQPLDKMLDRTMYGGCCYAVDLERGRVKEIPQMTPVQTVITEVQRVV
jgi:hypothetical protein